MNRNSGKAMDVSSVSTADGTQIHKWTDHNGTNQRFRLADSAGGYVRLIGLNSGKAVEVAGLSTADGANIQQWGNWNCSNGTARFPTNPTYAAR